MADTRTQFYSKAQIEHAKEVSLVDFLRDRGYKLEKHGNSAFKVAMNGHDSTVVFPETNSWYSFAEQVGGDGIKFLEQYENLNFAEAVSALLGGAQAEGEKQEEKKIVIPQPKDFELPPQAENNNRVYAYLVKSRGLDRDLVKQMIDKGLIYQSEQVIEKDDKSMKFNNCVFVGKDENGETKYATQRSIATYENAPQYKADVAGSEKAVGFLVNNKESNWITITESPIDALSYLSLMKLDGKSIENENVLSLGGVSDKALERFLEHHKEVNVINIALDSDRPGREAGEKIKEKFFGLGYEILESYPKEKDYNLQLTKARTALLAPVLKSAPTPAPDNKRMWAHLLQRGVDRDTIAKMENNGTMFQSDIQKDDKVFSEIVFVNRDKQGRPTYAISSSFNADTERPAYVKQITSRGHEQYIYQKGKNDKLLVFDNPIAMIAHQSYAKTHGIENNSSYLLCSKGAAKACSEIIEGNSKIKSVIHMADDRIGHNVEKNETVDYRQNSFNSIVASVGGKVSVSQKYPEHKSWANEFKLSADKEFNKQKATSKAKSKEEDYENER